MKHTLLILTLALLPVLSAAQKTTAEDFQRRYNNLAERVGPSGLGVETLLNQWEAAFPDDANLYRARFLLYLDQAHQVGYIRLDADRYLGAEPLLAYTDSLGVQSNIFEDISYEPTLFAQAEKSLGQAIRLQPLDLDLRLGKISALMGYEKESPEMATRELCGLVDYHYLSKPAWTYLGESVDEEVFIALIQDYCFSLFRLQTPTGFESFRIVSEKVLKYRPDDPLFLDNVGSYWLVGKHDSKKALKYYNKVLKSHPDDLTAIKNCILLARNEKDVKLEKKYLAMLAKYGPTEIDREGAQRRLDALETKK